MGAAKPCLGYPSRTLAVHGMRRQGLSTRQIAQAIGIEDKTVIALEVGSSRVRKALPVGGQRGRTIIVPVDVLDALGPHAARRCISVNHLARLLLSTVVDEGMVDAVMDDANSLDWSGT